MVSQAVASVDAWLARAEQVLQAQQEHGISPSSVPWDDEREEWVLPLASFVDALEDLLGRLCRRPGRWILIAEDNEHRHHFWQALAFEDGSLVTETVSNFYLEGEDCWTPEQESRLHALGWECPKPPKRPNWIKVEYTTSPSVDEVARRTSTTLREVFGLGANDEVFVKLTAELTPALDIERLVDRLVAHLHHRIVRVLEAQAPGDLLGGPKLLKAFDDLGKERRAGGHLGWFRTTGLLLRPNMAAPGPVVMAASVRRHFTADGGGRLADPISDTGERPALGQADHDFLSVSNRQSTRTGRPRCWPRLPRRPVIGPCPRKRASSGPSDLLPAEALAPQTMHHLPLLQTGLEAFEVIADRFSLYVIHDSSTEHFMCADSVKRGRRTTRSRAQPFRSLSRCFPSTPQRRLRSTAQAVSRFPGQLPRQSRRCAEIWR